MRLKKRKIAKDNKIAAIVLAAGKGVRMGAKKVNKVTLSLIGKPLIRYATDLCERSGIRKIVIVTGFAKDSIKKILGKKYIYANQQFQLGTAHAVSTGLKYLSPQVKDVLVFYADHCAFYHPEQIASLIDLHRKTKAALTFVTVKSDNPFGYGRILRGKKEKVLGIVEEKNARPSEKKIKEINPGTYCFKIYFLKKYLPKVEKNKVSGEYYITDLIQAAALNREKIQTFRVDNPNVALGINTPEELRQAEKIMRASKNGN